MKTNSIHYGRYWFYTIAMHYGTITSKNFKIILINNGGGGIFRILPGQKRPGFQYFFETSHCLTAEHLAKCMDLTIPLLVMNKVCQKD
jgi:2-succinyl-5-enolpyruvyl-6-hydroxy-3-cyclohexene-1-carboxylate synthase